jgi:hypothetical protein
VGHSQRTETKAKKGKRESLYQFYDSGLAKKSTGKSKGIFVAVKPSSVKAAALSA